MSEEVIVRPVVVDPWPAAGIEVAFEATPDARRTLAERFGLVAVGRFVGHARLDRSGSRAIHLSGRLEADVVQSCVVSLEDVAATVAEAFECRFTRTAGAAPDGFAWDEDVEPLEGAELDLGEIFAQQLSLALDPYPRAADAYTLVAQDLGPNIAFGEDEPMSALASAMMDRAQGAAPPRQGRE